ncbi:MAG: hypothetical protein H6825_08565 [Planctomycetes bacterium]|nr:hypothetical protein [Planctomycetota bacterium]
MLLTTLALATSILLPQDASAAAPVLDEAVAEYLSTASEKLYDPVEAGLESLAFDVDFTIPGNPMLGSTEPVRVATFAISWNKDSGSKIEVTMAEGIDPQVSAMLAQSGMTADVLKMTIAQLPVQYALNLSLDPRTLVEAFDGKLGSTDGAASIEFKPRPTAKGVVAQSIVWNFDRDSVLATKVTKGPSPMGGTTTNTETYSWKAAQVGEGLLLDHIAVSQDMGMVKLTNSLVPEYRVVDGLVIMTGYTQHSDGIPAMGVPASDSAWTFQHLVVNGVPVDAPAPAAAGSGSDG